MSPNIELPEEAQTKNLVYRHLFSKNIPMTISAKISY